MRRRFISTDVCLFGALMTALPGVACTGKVSDAGAGTTWGGGALSAGTLPLRRLTNREYDNTVRDLLGDTSQPASQFPVDHDSSFLFHRAGDLALQDATLLRSAAETLAANARAKLVPSGLLPCDPATGEPACAEAFIASFGRRAYRRGLTKEESGSLNALYGAARSGLSLGFTDALTVVVEAVLQAPQLLYHWEAAPSDATVKEGGLLRLSGTQLASRLSYFLWGSMPDDALLTAAESGKLDTPEGIESEARRLLDDARAKATVSTFFLDWLELGGLPDRTKSASAYPGYTSAVQAALLQETRTFVEKVAFEGDGTFATLLGAPYSFIDKTLAPFYGVSGGTAPAMVSLPSDQRAGLLTQGAFLAYTGNAEGSNPVRRGHAIYTKLLCKTLAPPPANVPLPKPASAGGTTRQRFEEHDQNSCAKSCHGVMDPIGFGFEHYDGIGQYRVDDNGQPVDATGSITLDGAVQSFDGAVSLAGLLAASAEVRSCFARQWVRFALLHQEAPADEPSVAAVANAFGTADATLKDLLVAITRMPSFRYRTPSPGETP